MKTLNEIYQALRERYPDNGHQYSKEFTPFQMLCFIILTQQTSDERAYLVAKRLFSKYPTSQHMAVATPTQVAELIKNCGLADKRSKALVKNAQLLEEYRKSSKQIKRSTIREFQLVGPKTEKIILHEVFGKPTFPIDTHIERIFKRLYMQDLTHEEIEYFVTLVVDEENWLDFHKVLIEHGRETCSARKVLCSTCPINDSCEYYRQYKLGGKKNETETIHGTNWIYRN